MSVESNRYRSNGGGGGRDLERLERAMERLAERVGKLERSMWIMTGLGGATVATAVYNLVQNLQQNAGP